MTAEPGPASEREDGLPGIERLLTLSDGVVAIALTLLVLQLRVPPLHQVANPHSAADLAAQLGNGGSQLVSYAISYYVIAQFWLAHHRAFRQIRGHQEGLAWWNFAFLFTITVMPFTSGLLGAYGSNPLAIDIFAANLLLASLATQGTVVFGSRRGLLTAGDHQRPLRAGLTRAAVSTVVMATSMALAWVNTDAAKYCWLLIAVAPWAANNWSSRRADQAAIAEGE